MRSVSRRGVCTRWPARARERARAMRRRDGTDGLSRVARVLGGSGVLSDHALFRWSAGVWGTSARVFVSSTRLFGRSQRLEGGGRHFRDLRSSFCSNSGVLGGFGRLFARIRAFWAALAVFLRGRGHFSGLRGRPRSSARLLGSSAPVFARIRAFWRPRRPFWVARTVFLLEFGRLYARSRRRSAPRGVEACPAVFGELPGRFSLVQSRLGEIRPTSEAFTARFRRQKSMRET